MTCMFSSIALAIQRTHARTHARSYITVREVYVCLGGGRGEGAVINERNGLYTGVYGESNITGSVALIHLL